MLNFFVKLISTFFFIGYFPLAPGSAASLAGAVLYCYFFQHHLIAYIISFVVITFLGFIVSDRMEAITGLKDPSCIVVDEVSGIMISFFLLPLEPSVCVATFFLFRAFDMFKIYPVNKMEGMKGGVGVMMDDIVAGIYTNLTMQVAVRLAGIV